MMSPRSQRGRGQALVEMTLIAPVLVLLMLGAADLGRAFYLSIQIEGASRAGLRGGVVNGSNDIGALIRSEPNSAIPNTAAVWGDTGPGGLNADCTSGTQKCGDPTGCPSTVFTGSRVACFAIRTCTLGAGGCSAPFGTWQSRPAVGSDLGLDIQVWYSFQPVTPLITQYATGTGFFYLRAELSGLELY